MNADSWKQIEDCYHAAMERPVPERAAFLAQACANDSELRREVESLLAHEGQADELLESPAWDQITPVDETGTFAPGALVAGCMMAEYRISAKLGSGGMGEVYRATDTKLQREVALKVLAPGFAQNAAWMSRFQREARVLASLNHPHIAAIYGLEESDGVRAIAMELVEGPTLAERMGRGRVPIPEALVIARQIAEALEYAHEKGIVHRDLKPANVKLRSDGVVKVLDFGLAKAAVPGGSTKEAPAVTATRTGVIMGTPAYMAPEQAAGLPVDRRADIWAFGVVLFEMLSGRQIYARKTTLETLAAVARDEPAWSELPPGTPAEICRLLRRCLDRDVKNRLRDIGEARIALQEDRSEAAPETASPGRTRRLWLAGAGALLLILILVLIRDWRFSSPSNGTPVRVTMDLTPAANLAEGIFGRASQTAMVFSPDGNTLVFSGVHGGPGSPGSRTQLYRRALDQAEAVPIPGTEGASGPFISPDGKWVGFGSDGKLQKVSMSGGPAVAICALKNLWGATWGAADTVVFSEGGALMRVPAAGGTPQVLVQQDSSKSEVFSSPEFLPDGKTLLFTARTSGDWGEAQTVARRPDTGERRVLVKGGANARYVPTGHLVYLRNSALMAVPFDAHRLQCTGTPVPLLDGVMQAVSMPNTGFETGMGQFAVSHPGLLVYASGGIYPERRTTLVRVDRKGTITDLNLPQGNDFGLRLSPDGQRLAVKRQSRLSRSSEIWIYDLIRGTATRLTTQGQISWPLWSPDGKRILFGVGPGEAQIVSIMADGQGTAETVATGNGDKGDIFPASWSPDGKWLAYCTRSDKDSMIWVRSASGEGEPKLFLGSKFLWGDPEISPDGRWMAYSSGESGALDVYVQAFPGPGERHRISTDGGGNPAWARNGRELFYLNQSRLMAVDIAAGNPFQAGAPRMLFEGGFAQLTHPLRSYDVYPDGQHFIMVRPDPLPDQRVTRLNIVLNWFEELKRRAPSGGQ